MCRFAILQRDAIFACVNVKNAERQQHGWLAASVYDKYRRHFVPANTSANKDSSGRYMYDVLCTTLEKLVICGDNSCCFNLHRACSLIIARYVRVFFGKLPVYFKLRREIFSSVLSHRCKSNDVAKLMCNVLWFRNSKSGKYEAASILFIKNTTLTPRKTRYFPICMKLWNASYVIL